MELNLRLWGEKTVLGAITPSNWDSIANRLPPRWAVGMQNTLVVIWTGQSGIARRLSGGWGK
jgi:hypothetical protein